MWKTTDLLGKLALLYFRISLNLPFGCTLTTFLDIFFPYTWNAPFSPRFSNVFVYRNGFSVNLPFGVTLTTFLGYSFFSVYMERIIQSKVSERFCLQKCFFAFSVYIIFFVSNFRNMTKLIHSLYPIIANVTLSASVLDRFSEVTEFRYCKDSCHEKCV